MKNDGSIRFYRRKGRYELWFMDEFTDPGKQADGSLNTDLCDVLTEMAHADFSRELHVFIYSVGGSITVLSALLSLIKRFRKTVAVNLGQALSCGWTLFFSCDERYASRHSTFMYHAISWEMNDKLKTLKMKTSYLEKLQKILDEDSTRFLTEEEKRLGKTTEVYLTGDTIIWRGGCKDFSLYDKE